MQLQVEHDAGGQRFEAQVAGGRAACAYVLRDGVMDVVHTEVPPPSQHHGVAAALVSSALAHARALGLRVRPSCSYVRSYMRRHAETQDLLER
jgi:predicted GNAT family acetyltransferase